MVQNKCNRRSLSVDGASLVASGKWCCPSAMKDCCQSLDLREDFDLFTSFVFAETADRMRIMDPQRSFHLIHKADVMRILRGLQNNLLAFCVSTL